MEELYKHQCPECGGYDLRVTVEAVGRLIPIAEGYDIAEVDDYDQIEDPYWDRDSFMSCQNEDCAFEGRAKDFEKPS